MFAEELISILKILKMNATSDVFNKNRTAYIHIIMPPHIESRRNKKKLKNVYEKVIRIKNAPLAAQCIRISEHKFIPFLLQSVVAVVIKERQEN